MAGIPVVPIHANAVRLPQLPAKPQDEPEKEHPVATALKLALKTELEAKEPFTAAKLTKFARAAASGIKLLRNLEGGVAGIFPGKRRRGLGFAFGGGGGGDEDPIEEEIGGGALGGPDDYMIANPMAPAPFSETFANKAVRELVAVASRFVEAKHRASPEDLIKAIAAARSAKLDEIATKLEKQLLEMTSGKHEGEKITQGAMAGFAAGQALRAEHAIPVPLAGVNVPGVGPSPLVETEEGMAVEVAPGQTVSVEDVAEQAALEEGEVE